MLSAILSWIKTSFRRDQDEAPLDAETIRECAALAKDLNLNESAVQHVWRRLNADLAACDEADPHPFELLQSAASRISKKPTALDIVKMQMCVNALTPRQRALLALHKLDMRPEEIAQAVDSDYDSVLNELVKIYAELRMTGMSIAAHEEVPNTPEPADVH